VQEPDEPVLGDEYRPIAVRLLAEQHHAGSADRLLERLQIGEVVMLRVDGCDADRVRLEPADALGDLRPGPGDAVEIRFAGVSYRDRLVRRAGVIAKDG
jgi:hypothetical protein